MPFITNAYAAADASAAHGFDIATFAPLLIIFVLFWLFFMRPQQKKAKELQDMISALAIGDEIMTQGGIAGRVKKVGDRFLTVEIANNVDIQIQSNAVLAKLEKGTFKAL